MPQQSDGSYCSAQSLFNRYKWASTLFVHFSLIMGVAAYTVFGALTMQYLESPTRVRSQIKRSLPERTTTVFLGEELAKMDEQVHKCLESTISKIMDRTNCDLYEIEHLNIDIIDQCYANAEVYSPETSQVAKRKPKQKQETSDEPIDPRDKWSMGNSVIFAFTVITTIGYGHIAPETFEGRLFCILYGLIGVPFTLLTIADLGMFLTKLLRLTLQLARRSSNRIWRIWGRNQIKKMNFIKSTILVDSPQKEEEDSKGSQEDDKEEEEDAIEPRKSEESIALGMTFTFYLLLGAKILSVYEPEMDFFNALYFNFVTLTTIGLGDFVPKSFDYLFITLVYIGIGLALTTMTIEIAADLLKKIHYAGRKMENAAAAVVWFGGKKMTMKSLVKYLGDQFNIPEDEMANFDVTQFVDNAIKVEKGEIATLRKPTPIPTVAEDHPVVFRERAFSYSNLRKSSELQYVDDSRVSKFTDPIVNDTSRTIDTLQALVIGNPQVPPIDLDLRYFSNISPRGSFDENYLQTFTDHRK